MDESTIFPAKEFRYKSTLRSFREPCRSSGVHRTQFPAFRGLPGLVGMEYGMGSSLYRAGSNPETALAVEAALLMILGIGIILIAGIWALSRMSRGAFPTFQKRPVTRTPYDGLFLAYGAKYRVDPNTLEAIALWEHRGNIRPDAVAKEENGSESLGVMQLNSSNLAWIGKALGFSRADLFNAEKNIEAGAALMQKMRQELAPSGLDTQDNLIQAWSLGTPKVKQGVRNYAYLTGVKEYLA